MARSALTAIVLAAMLPCAALAQPAPEVDARAFHAKVVALYSFEPHTLDRPQIEAKSKQLDGFWDEVKADLKRNLPLLRRELQDPGNSAFFFYDGAKLLLTVSQERDDRALALAAIPRADLRGVQHTDYLRTVHWLATKELDTTKAALRILDYPDFKAFIPQHVLTLGQNYSLIYMLFPMPDSNYVPALIERLQREDKPESQKSILLALWYAMAPQARAATVRFVDDDSKPQASRDYARQLVERKAPVTGFFTLSSVEALKAQRRKVMHRLSDEALYEFDSLTAKILAKQ